MRFAVDEVGNRVKRSFLPLHVASIINIGWTLEAVKRAIGIQLRSTVRHILFHMNKCSCLVIHECIMTRPCIAKGSI